jgi:pseudaminic acid synthase
LRQAGGGDLALLKCTSAYPAPADDMHLRTIPHMAQAFGVPVGLSDHTLDLAVPVAAAVLGACIIEKHLTLDRRVPGPDAAFSLEPHEFKAMVEAVRVAGRAMGRVHYGVSPTEAAGRVFRKSLFVVEDVPARAVFDLTNVRAIRPGHGLHPRHLEQVLGRRATRDVARGTPLAWDLVG